MHWRARHRAQLVYRTHCDVARAQARMPLFRMPMERAELRAALHVWNRYDPDGAVALLKWPVDWLVATGYLAGDTHDRLLWTIPEQHIDRSSPRIVLTLRELLDDNTGGTR
jgi:hypothetical protein